MIDAASPCVLAGTKVGEGLAIQGPDGKLIVHVSRIPSIEKVSLQLAPAAALGKVQAENKTFVFHGETTVKDIVVYPKQGTLAQAGTTYRPWARLEPGSARADGKVSLAATQPYPWFVWKKGPSPSSLPVQVACAELSLNAPTNTPRPRGLELRSDARAEFRDLAAGPVTAIILHAFDPTAAPGRDNGVEAFALGKTASGKLTQVDIRVGQDLNAIGWIPTTALRADTRPPATPAAESPPAAPSSASYTYRRCNMNTPLWATVSGASPSDPAGQKPRIVEFGYIKSGRPFRGALSPNGDFRVDLGDNDKWSDKVIPTDVLDPFVSKESLVTVGCGEISAASYNTP